jgi:hypothetical protein
MIQVLGKLAVPTAGTPVQLYSLLAAANFPFKAYHAIMLQANFNNTGKIYIGNAQMNKTTLVGCCAVLAIPTVAGAQSFGMALPLSPAGVDITALYLDADVNGESVLGSVLTT